MNEKIVEILTSAQTAFPGAWENAVRYTQTDAQIGMFVGSVMIGLGIGLLILVIRAGEHDDMKPIGIGIGIVLLSVGFSLLCGMAPAYLNPEGALIYRLGR